MAQEEHVLVIERKILEQAGMFQGLVFFQILVFDSIYSEWTYVERFLQSWTVVGSDGYMENR